MAKGPSERRAKDNVLTTARFHGRYLALWTLSAVVPIMALNCLLIHAIHLLWSISPPDEASIWTPRSVALAAVLEVVIILMMLFLIYLVTAHRIAGPFLNIKRTLDRLNSGDMSARLRFRESDGLNDIATAFNAMLDRKLAARNGSGDPVKQNPSREGFTLIEIMICITIMAIATGFAISSFRKMAERQHLKNASGSLAIQLSAARAEAMSRNVALEVALVSAGSSLRKRADFDGNGSITGSETTITPISSANKVTIDFSTSSPIFTSLGQCELPSTPLCITVTSINGAGSRYVYVLSSGEVRESEEMLSL